MINLERRALLGDRQAQEECTRQGIVLPCPCCNDEQPAHGDFQNFEYVQCLTCGLEIKIVKSNGWPSAISRWNTRPAPPVGNCGECRFADTKDGGIYCELDDYQREEYEFCSEFEPKGGEENG